MPRYWFAYDSHLKLALLSILVGIVGGLGAALFRAMIAFVHNLGFFGQISLFYDANVHTEPSPWGLGVILVPIVGAVIVVFLVKNFAPEAKGHGVPEVMDAIYYNRGIIRPVVAVVKSLASAVSIGTGGSVGREGPIMQISSSFGSAIGQVIRMPQWHRITLIGAGAAGGIAATFNTPIGGLLFAIELILPETSARTLVPVGLATGVASFLGQVFFGTQPAFEISGFSATGFDLVSGEVMLCYLLLGVVVGFASLVYVRSIYVSEDLFDSLPVNEYVRHIFGMFMVGVMMFSFMTFYGHYFIEGVGYATVQNILESSLAVPSLLLLLFFAKMLATALTLGSGASGGIFSPALFLGATLGAAYALLVGQMFPDFALSAPNMAVAGMAGMVGASTGAVLTAIVMVFEMTRDYGVIIPLMVTVSIAYGIRRALMRDSIYTFKLTRRGHFIADSLQSNMFMLRRISDMLDTPMVHAADTITVAEIPEWKRHSHPDLPHVLVVDKEKQIKGVLSVERRRTLGPTLGTVSVIEHMDTKYVTVSADDILFDVVGRMRTSKCELALVTPDGELSDADDVVGIISLQDIANSSSLISHVFRRQGLLMEAAKRKASS